MRWKAGLLVAATTLTTCACAASPGAGGSSAAGGATVTWRGAAQRFLDHYVSGSGRVVRHDQGGDTVSEGQSYALLLAGLVGDRPTFDRVWRWTREQLATPDGLLAWRWDGGRVSRDPATDADLVTAWALQRSGDPATTRDAARDAGAIVAEESVSVGSASVLTAGPWATRQVPAVVNPSYWALPAFDGLRGLVPRMSRLGRDAVAVTSRLTDDGQKLPPDWAVLTAEGPRATPAPGGSGGSLPKYGPDAQRTVVWFAASCDDRARALAASWWRILGAGAKHESAAALLLDGTVVDADRTPLALVASAAAADAAGEHGRADGLLGEAAKLARQHPTYYGDAWVALGAALLRGPLRCATSGR